jgi:hypothetical protein
MAVPLASSTHLKFDPFTEAVVGALVELVGVAVATVVRAGVGDAVAVAEFVGPSLLVHEQRPRAKTAAVNANPKTLTISFSSFELGW